MTRSSRALLAGGIFALSALPAVAQVTFAELATKRRPQAAELEVESLLAEARRAALGGLAREGPTAGVEAGPRRTPDAETSDVAVRVDLPLEADVQARRELRRGLDGLAASARSGARAEAGAALATAFVAAWEAQAVAKLRERDLEAVDAWLDAVRRRVDAGAEPPYESVLVAGERDRALVELAEARRANATAWGELGALVELPEIPEPLSLAGLPGPDSAPAEDGIRAALAGVEARRTIRLALARATAAASNSRWSLAGQIGREGEDRLARVGVAYRFPLRGEHATVAAERAAAEESARRDGARRAAELLAELAAAEATLRTPASALDTAALDAAENALIARVREGKERVSAVLPLRRQLLEARIAAVRASALRACAAAVVSFLGQETKG